MVLSMLVIKMLELRRAEAAAFLARIHQYGLQALTMNPLELSVSKPREKPQ